MLRILRGWWAVALVVCACHSSSAPAGLRFDAEGDALVPRFTADAAGTALEAHVRYRPTSFSVEDAASGLGIEVRTLGATAMTPEARDGSIVYRGAYHGGDVTHRPSIEGTEDFVSILRPQPGVDYDVALDDVAGLRLVANVLEFLNEAGSPRLRLASPFLLDASGTRHDVTIAVTGCAVDTSSLPPWRRPVTPPGATHCTVHLAWSVLRDAAYPALLDPSWVTTGSMAAQREEHQALMLGTGLVLVSGGGTGGSNPVATCEYYDPDAGTWSMAPTMNQARMQHTLTLLNNGRALAAGGISSGGITDTAEVLDPSTATWNETSYDMNKARARQSAVIQPSTGHVLMSGGNDGSGITHAAEAFFGGGSKWIGTANMNDSRQQHGSAYVNNVATVFGGNNGNGTYYDTVETYDPSNNSWNETTTMNVARSNFAMVQLSNANVVVAGGDTAGGQTNTAEILNASSGAWSLTGNLNQARSGATLSLLGNDTTLLAGGLYGSTWLNAAETYDPTTNAWTTIASLNVGRGLHTATVITDGTVLVAGGYYSGGTTNTAEIIQIPQTCGTSGGDCLSGICMDGYCCNEACDNGPCQHCNVPGGEGICTYEPAGQLGSPSCDPYICTGNSPNCETSCSADSDCASDGWCDSTGECVSKEVNGTDCTASDQCTSGVCVAGICCNESCNGPCASCSSGTCEIAAAGKQRAGCVPYLCNGTSGECPTTCSSNADCVSGDYCSGDSCVPLLPPGSSCANSQQCSNGLCANGICCNTDCSGPCDVCTAAQGSPADGTCGPAPAGTVGSPSCAPALCDGTDGTCPSTCGSDGDCAFGAYCNNGVCQYQMGPGGPCATPDSCTTGLYCAAGVCCNTSCGDPCQACDSEGNCATSPEGGTPNGSCGAYLCDGSDTGCPSSCGSDADCASDNYCNSSSHCVPVAGNGAACDRATECSSGFCSGGTCCNSACDDGCDACGSGTCLPVAAGAPGNPSCAPFVCDGTDVTCPQSCASDSGCIAGDFCAAGTCMTQLPAGSSCTGADQCASGFCVDGVCCNDACAGQCSSCAQPDSLGTCSAAPAGAPVGGRPACTTDGTACGGACDGQTTDTCAYPGGSTTCGGACSGSNLIGDGTCNGAGTCASATTVACAPYGCAQGACLTQCGSNADCASSAMCQAGTCVEDQPNGSACTAPDQCASGQCVNEVCCETTCDGACGACNLPGQEGQCAPLAAGTPAPDSSCLPILCDGASTSCPLTCQSSADCLSGFICSQGNCMPQPPAGLACSSAAECASGFCVDGVCCDSACDGSCQTCDATGSEGTCTLVTGAAAPGRPACGGDGPCGSECDGQHSGCTFPGGDKVCSPGFCTDGVAISASLCDGDGRCLAGTETQCIGGCSGDHCAPASAFAGVKPGCASTDSTALGLLTLLLVLARRGLMRRSSSA